MKKLFTTLLGFGVAACQPQAATTAVLAIVSPGHESVEQGLSGIRLAATDSLSPAMHAFAQRHDLSAMWQAQENEGGVAKELPTVYEGFFGPDHYRIELVFLKVSRDAADSLLYHVRGKSRYKKRIAAFIGDIRLQRLRRVSIKNFEYELQGVFARFYTARGEFEFRETGVADASTFAGVIGIDFQQKADSSLTSTHFWGDEHKQYANGGRLRLSGEWISAQTGLRKQLVAGPDITGISQEVLPDFNIGERGFTLSPKYVKLGWDKYWENDEWWADMPKPSLNL